jgi:chaperonin GroES
MIKPLADYVLIKPEKPADKTPGGIVLPERAKERSERGTVMALGTGAINEDGCTRRKFDVSVKDEVLFSRYGGHEIEDGGEQLLLVKSSDLLGIVSSSGK